jgi:membrane-associated phospholipid phosphatase
VALRDRTFALAPTPRLRALLAALALAFVALTALVAVGALTRLDQFSLDHLMPWLAPGESAGSSVAGFYRPFTLHTTTAVKLLALWTYPCSVLVSGVVIVCASLLLWRRLGPVEALVLPAAWAIGNAIEVAGKGLLVRPALYGTANGARVHVTAFDDSFPSGHMMRGVLVAGAVVLVWSRASRWAVVWAVLVAPALVLQAAHTITDVVGGALVGLILLVPVFAIVRPGEPRK